MPPFRPPQLEKLEDRCTPAVFGSPWEDPSHVTVSFAPDGAKLLPAFFDNFTMPLNGRSSKLFAGMNAQMSQAVWQGEILRALQAWATETGTLLSVVGDGGDNLGIDGTMQGDSRFGDIRIFGADLSTDAIAITVPPSAGVGTSSGDIIFNTRYNFGAGAGASTCSARRCKKPGTPSEWKTVRIRLRLCMSRIRACERVSAPATWPPSISCTIRGRRLLWPRSRPR